MDRVHKRLVQIAVEMSNRVRNKHCLDALSFGGLFVFLSIHAMLKIAFDSDQSPRLHWKVQAGLPAGLNLYYNLPTVYPQGQSGYAHKAVARPLGVSRFCVFQQNRPYARGKPRAPS